jgi:hypothetical protein
MAGDIHAVTNLSHLSLAGTLYSGAASLSSEGRLTLGSGTSLVVESGATVTLMPAAQVSIGTIAAHSSLASLAGLGMQVGVIFRASGLSLVFRSANSVYYLNSDASGAA